MTVSAIVTLGYGQGIRYIATLGYLSETTPPPTPTSAPGGGGKKYPVSIPAIKTETKSTYKPVHVQQFEYNERKRIAALEAERKENEAKQQALEAQAKQLEARRKNRLDDKALQTQIVSVLTEIHDIQMQRAAIERELFVILDDEEVIALLLISDNPGALHLTDA